MLVDANTPSEQQQRQMFNFGVRLFASHRVYRERIKDSWVYFAPDAEGYPVLVQNWVNEVFNSFANGDFAGRVISYHSKNIPAFKLMEAISLLEERGFLRDAPSAKRYTAIDGRDSVGKGFGIWLHINNYCNLDCEYCFVDKFKAQMSRDVMAETIAKIVSTVKKRGIEKLSLKFAGGEPTLSVPAMEWFYDQLAEQLRGTSLQLSIAVLSNGTNGSDRLLEFLKRPNVGIGISLDGYGAESHDIYRVFKGSKRGSWDLIMRNIERMRDVGVVPYIMATVSELSSPTLPNLVRWIFSNGMRTRISVVRQPTPDAFRAYTSVPRGQDSVIPRHKRTIQDEYRALNESMIDAFEKAFQELEREEYGVDVITGLEICELHFDSPSYTACCGIGTNHVVIQDDGKLASCPMTVRETNVPATFDLLKSIQDTFAHSPAMRNAVEEKNCLDCNWFPVCVSGCPVNNLRMKGVPFTISPLHEYYDYVIPRFVRFAGNKMFQDRQKSLSNSDFVVIDKATEEVQFDD